MLVTKDQIVLAPATDCTIESMDYLVYGWAPRFLRVLRGQFSVHASAVRTAGGALAIMGQPQAGKSTTVMGLIGRGYPLIIDDVLPVDFIDAVPIVHGWDRPIHLRDSAAEYFGVTRERFVNVPSDVKVQVRIPAHSGRVPLRCLIEMRPLSDATEVTLIELQGRQALTAALRSTNATGIASGGGRGEQFFAWVTSLVDAVPVYQLVRPQRSWCLDSVLDRIDALVLDLGLN